MVPAEGETVDAARLRVAILRLSRRLRKHELAGLTPTKLSALATVEHSGPLRLRDLAAAERIAPSTLSRLVSALEAGGHVERCADPEDGRGTRLAITPAGREVLARIRGEGTALLRESLRKLPARSQASLAAALSALEELADSEPLSRADQGNEARQPEAQGQPAFTARPGWAEPGCAR
jgi:DNA-binding MarR family transcriptional regulator